MVKVKSWLFTEVRGKVKKAEFRRRKNKVTELSQKRIPFNPRTEAQQKVRKAYGQCVEEWNKLSESEKREWRIVGTLQGISGYNAFMRECISKKIGAVWYEITIDNSANSNDLTDYQILLEIVNDSTFFEDCENEQKYLEFYDTDKSTLLNHFVEEFDTTNKNAKIWIKVPSIPANSTKTIYLKINKSRTTDLSNPDNVFDFYDDFEDGVIDETKWTIISDNWVEENGYLKGTGTGTDYTRKTIRAEGVCLKNFVAVMIWKVSQEDCLANFIYRAQNTNIETADRYWARIESRSSYGQGIHMLKSVGGSESDLGNKVPYSDVTTFKKFIMKIHEDEHYYEVEGEGSATITDSSIMNEGYFGFQTEKYSTLVEIIYIRKYSKPEPTVSYAKT